MFKTKEKKMIIKEFDLSLVTYKLTMSNDDVIEVEINSNSSVECFCGECWIAYTKSKDELEHRIKNSHAIDGVNYGQVTSYKELKRKKKTKKYLIIGNNIYDMDEMDVVQK